MTYAIYNPYTEQFWFKDDGSVETYPSVAKALAGRVKGQKDWKRENGTTLWNDEAWIVVYETHHREAVASYNRSEVRT